MKIAVIDYEAGNIRSVQRALQAAAGPEATVEVTSDPAKIRDAYAAVFPGQGAAGQCMTNLNTTHLSEIVRERINSGRPFMGVCVGLQLLFSHLEEDDTAGLGVLPGEVRRFPDRPGLKVPQIGWNEVRQTNPSPLWENVPNGSYFYFVHSYYPDPALWARDSVVGVTDYGFDFASAFTKDNWMATQFHPEKSGKLGLQLYKNFLTFAGTL
ncbi:MAG: imidazole glycerol phosphate synthase subunit HisH [Chloroflexi bacterium]|nr:imidazole glycerol phosphate synthase subunit HisH [Chloroflexota bacterium]OJV99849.1 MAG: imidazole glycerol phosphate synthase, glutamine amidotransferase subunit [Chloroflexi bacterium 54-19]